MKVGDLVHFRRATWETASQRADDVGLVIKTTPMLESIGQYVRVLWNGKTKSEVYFSDELEVIK